MALTRRELVHHRRSTQRHHVERVADFKPSASCQHHERHAQSVGWRCELPLDFSFSMCSTMTSVLSISFTPPGMVAWSAPKPHIGNRDAAAQIIEMLDVRPDDKVLEVGFGPGVAIQLLLHRVPTGSVAGVDYSQEMASL